MVTKDGYFAAKTVPCRPRINDFLRPETGQMV